MTTDTGDPAHYQRQYRSFASDLDAEVRSAVYGDDVGQNGWLTTDEHDLFIGWLGAGEHDRLLEPVAHGVAELQLHADAVA